MIGCQTALQWYASITQALWRVTERPAVLLIAILISVAGCPEYKVIVKVPVPPKITFDRNIKEYQIYEFAGPAECASDIKEGIDAKAKNSGYLVPTIIGLPDLDGPLDIKGRVDTCSLRMGYGVIKATMALSHGGRQLHQETVNEETNRPGASTDEVRAALIDRTVNRFVGIFLPTEKPEMRELRPKGGQDPGWISARDRNWLSAIDTWTKRVGEDPKDHRAWYSRGVSYEANGQLPEAIKDYKKAVELEPTELYLRMLSRAEQTKRGTIVIETQKKARE